MVSDDTMEAAKLVFDEIRTEIQEASDRFQHIPVGPIPAEGICLCCQTADVAEGFEMCQGCLVTNQLF